MISDEVLGKAPPECQTHSEKVAFAFGWFKAMEQIEAAVLAEREACAKVCDDFGAKDYMVDKCSAAIRSRGK